MNPSEVINRLGGTKVVAALCGVRPPSVSQWRWRGIPRAQENFLRTIRPDVFAPRPAKAKRA